MKTLSELLDEGGARHGVRRKLLEQILQIERVNTYLLDSKKENVHETIRKLILAESKTHANNKA